MVLPYVVPSAALTAMRNNVRNHKFLTLVVLHTSQVSQTGTPITEDNGESCARATHVLLGMKKRGFGAGRWNGFGGKVESGETIVDAAARELLEEANVHVASNALEHCGTLLFDFADAPEARIMHVCVFRVSQWSGNGPTESEEMRPQWFPVDEIPFNNMWEDDYLWYPYVLQRKYFYGSCSFSTADLGSSKVLSHDIKEVGVSSLKEMDPFCSEKNIL